VHICTEVLLGKGAKLKLVILNHGVAQNWEYNALNVRQQAESEFVLITISDDGMVRRNATYVDLVAPKAKCDLNFLTRAAGHSQVFEHVVVNHQAAECESRQLAKAILDDAAITEFNGTIKVVAQAQHTVAHQLNRNLLLSAQAKASARPQMRVLANQVECTHGATIGQLDDEQVFYFLSRGFSPEQARKILVTGFAEEIMAKLAG
jgi:Fe-S cluster assembly protein SufD